MSATPREPRTLIPAEGPAHDAWEWLRGQRVTTWTTLGLLALALLINIVLQPNFFSQYSIMSTAASLLPVILVAFAQAIVVIGGGLDLSLGAIVALSSVVAVQVMQGDSNRLLLGVGAAVLTGALAGAVNGAIVALLRLQPLIVTFATSFVFGGLALAVLPTPGGSVPDELRGLFKQAVAGLPMSAVLILLVIVVWLLIRRLRIFQHIRAVGGGATEAYNSLVPVVRTQWITYTIAGGIAGLAGLMLLANTGSGDAAVGGTFALNAVAAVVIGGIALRGGIGSPLGAVAGATILLLASNALFYVGLSTPWRALASGLVVIAALALSALTSKGARR